MKWFLDLFSSTLGRKLIMALTGLFLISFLLIHLIGNLQLLKHDELRTKAKAFVIVVDSFDDFIKQFDDVRQLIKERTNNV